jgi:hypothetical protein
LPAVVPNLSLSESSATTSNWTESPCPAIQAAGAGPILAGSPGTTKLVTAPAVSTKAMMALMATSALLILVLMRFSSLGIMPV